MKAAIVTGGSSGLGLETAKKIAAQQGWRVVLACRSAEKARAARERILADAGSAVVELLPLDTSSLDSVRTCAAAAAQADWQIDALVNNAGISAMGRHGASADGFDLVFATNYLGHYLLTRLLLPLMSDDARIYNVTSDMHNPPGGIDWPGTDVVSQPAEGDRRTYFWSKLALIYFTHELDRRLRERGTGILVNSFNPGFMADTNFSAAGQARALEVKTTMPERYGTLEDSSDALAQLVVDAHLPGVSGAYFDRSTRTAPSSSLSYDEANARELWSASAGLTGLTEDLG